MTDEEFIQRLVDAGWTREEAKEELVGIQEEEEEDWEGQL